MTKRPRSKPVASGNPRVHFDAGAPRPRDHLDELPVRYVAVRDDREARADLLAYLARLLDGTGEG